MASQIIADNTYLDDNGTIHRNGKILGRVERSGRDFEGFDAKGKCIDTYVGPIDNAARALITHI